MGRKKHNLLMPRKIYPFNEKLYRQHQNCTTRLYRKRIERDRDARRKAERRVRDLEDTLDIKERVHRRTERDYRELKRKYGENLHGPCRKTTRQVFQETNRRQATYLRIFAALICLQTAAILIGYLVI